MKGVGVPARLTGFVRRAGLNVLLNVIGLSLGLVAVELIFGSWVHSGFTNQLGILRSTHRTFDVSDLYPRSSSDPAVYTRDPNGLRGPFNSIEGIDVLTVGGSTTDQRYIADGETWQDALADAAGSSGIQLEVCECRRGRTLDVWPPALVRPLVRSTR